MTTRSLGAILLFTVIAMGGTLCAQDDGYDPNRDGESAEQHEARGRVLFDVDQDVDGAIREYRRAYLRALPGDKPRLAAKWIDLLVRAKKSDEASRVLDQFAAAKELDGGWIAQKRTEIAVRPKDEAPLAAMIRRLDSEASTRSQASQQLREFGEVVIAALIDYLPDSGPYGAGEVYSILANYPSPRVADAFRWAFESPKAQGFHALAAARRLAALPQAIAGPLIDAARKSPIAAVREFGLRALLRSREPDETVIADLKTMIHSGRANEMRAATGVVFAAFGEDGEPAAARKADPRWRELIRDGVLTAADGSFAEVFVQCTADEKDIFPLLDGDAPQKVKDAVLRAAVSSQPAWTATLARAVQSPGSFDLAFDRMVAAKKTIPGAVIAVALKNPKRKSEAANLLWNCTDADAADAAFEAAMSADPTIRARAIQYLRRVAPDKARSLAATVLDDPTTSIDYETLAWIAVNGGPETVRPGLSYFRRNSASQSFPMIAGFINRTPESEVDTLLGLLTAPTFADSSQRDLSRENVLARITTFTAAETRKKIFAAIPAMQRTAGLAVLKALRAGVSAADESAILALLDQETPKVGIDVPEVSATQQPTGTAYVQAITPTQTVYNLLPYLPKIGSANARARLLQALDSPSAMVRMQAIDVALADPGVDQVALFAKAAARTDDELAVFVNGSRNIRSDDSRKALLDRLAEALPETGMPRLHSMFTRNSLDLEEFLDLLNRTTDVAAMNFGRSVIGPLVMNRSDAKKMITTILNGLDTRKSTAILPIVKAALESSQREVRLAAVQSARNTFSVRAAEILLDALKDSDDGVREAAKDALAAIELYLTEKDNWSKRIRKLKQDAPTEVPASAPVR